MELNLDSKQTLAVQLCLDGKQRVAPVTGPAGTGKTSLMKYVYQTLTQAGYKTVACAPTGKAAKRIREATGIPAVTIHRLCEYTHPGERDDKTGKIIGYSYPKRCRQAPLEQDVILADEYAMVNQETHRALMDAMKPGSRICVFGDINQLPPIENTDKARSEPSPFATLLKAFNGVVLDTIHRQGEGSSIVINGQRILNGFTPQTSDEFRLCVTEKLVERVVDEVMTHMESSEDINYAKLTSQVLTPLNISWIGSHALNQRLQQALGPSEGDSITLPRHQWDSKHEISVRQGEKVLITQNMYEIDCSDHSKGVFNGETGIVVGLIDDILHIDLGDRIAWLPPILLRLNRSGHQYQYVPWRDIYLAYAMTVHKAQGSEYTAVTYVMGKSAFKMLNRHNFYTAVTRARKMVSVVTDQRGLFTALHTKKPAL